MYIEKISKRWGLPRKYCSCPGCGQEYGHHNTKVCANCEECSTCCKGICSEPDHRRADDIVPWIIEDIC